jgi:glutamate-1-semialdehyde 2,1-aminomutase
MKVPVYTTGAGSIVGIHFTSQKPRNHREAFELRWGKDLVEKTYNMYMRVNGVIYISESLAHLLLSVKHTKEDIKGFIELTRKFLEEVKKVMS